MNPPKRNVIAAGIEHSPERNASVTRKWITLCPLRYWTEMEMQNKYHVRHLNCSPAFKGVDKLWYIGVDGWIWSPIPHSGCCQLCMQHHWRRRVWSSEGPQSPQSALFRMTWLGHAIKWRKGLNALCLLRWAARVPSGPLDGLHSHRLELVVFSLSSAVKACCIFKNTTTSPPALCQSEVVAANMVMAVFTFALEQSCLP